MVQCRLATGPRVGRRGCAKSGAFRLCPAGHGQPHKGFVAGGEDGNGTGGDLGVDDCPAVDLVVRGDREGCARAGTRRKRAGRGVIADRFLFAQFCQLMSWQNSAIIGRAGVPTGQPGQNGHSWRPARTREAPKSAARGSRHAAPGRRQSPASPAGPLGRRAGRRLGAPSHRLYQHRSKRLASQTSR
jgi:hypothetical protein